MDVGGALNELTVKFFLLAIGTALSVAGAAIAIILSFIRRDATEAKGELKSVTSQIAQVRLDNHQQDLKLIGLEGSLNHVIGRVSAVDKKLDRLLSKPSSH